MSQSHNAAIISHYPHLAYKLRAAGTICRAAGRTLAPLLDIVIRLWLAQIFWLSGLVKIANWDTALTLARYEYPVSWLDPVSAAYLGAAIELICPLLLAFGLATRAAALGLFILTLVIQFSYQALNIHVYWALLFGWYVIMGAGPLSLDRLLSRGLLFSALPLAPELSRLLVAATQRLGPYYLLALRVLLALVWLGAALLPQAETLTVLSYRWHISADTLALPLLICAPLLLFGLATRFSTVAALMTLHGSLLMGATVLQGIDIFYWSLLLGLLLVHGPGALALDRAVEQWLARRLLGIDTGQPGDLAAVPQVVIVGAGFGGLAAARALQHAHCRVTLVDRHNYHLFQPLLYQVATASLSPADIAVPVRELLREQHNARVILGDVTGVDTARQEVILAQRRLNYDYLILATGARHAYFGRDEWETLAPGLKQIDDATHIRRRLLLAFEQAETSDDAAEQSRLLTFIIVGGGPTGVELAGAIAELARHGMAREFRQIDPTSARVVLVQSGARILPTFPESLSASATASLQSLGVEVLTHSRVEQIDADGVLISGQRIEARTVFWAAGVMASCAAEWLSAERDKAGRIKVGPDLSVPGLPNVFAIGDTALSTGWKGQPVPGLAPAAKQGGQYVAKLICARLEDRLPPPPFRYHHLGSLATIGRQAAVADFGKVRLRGATAWWLWGAVHVLFLAGMRSRILVAVQWFWAYLTFRRGTRLITGSDGPLSDRQLAMSDRTGKVERLGTRKFVSSR